MVYWKQLLYEMVKQCKNGNRAKNWNHKVYGKLLSLQPVLPSSAKVTILTKQQTSKHHSNSSNQTKKNQLLFLSPHNACACTVLPMNNAQVRWIEMQNVYWLPLLFGKEDITCPRPPPRFAISFGFCTEIWNNEGHGGPDLMKWAGRMMDACFRG